MENKMNMLQAVKKIMSDAEKITTCDELFTEALTAIEKYKWDECTEICNKILDICISIEQRLATLLILGLAGAQSEKNVDEYLQIAYDYEG